MRKNIFLLIFMVSCSKTLLFNESSLDKHILEDWAKVMDTKGGYSSELLKKADKDLNFLLSSNDMGVPIVIPILGSPNKAKFIDLWHNCLNVDTRSAILDLRDRKGRTVLHYLAAWGNGTYMLKMFQRSGLTKQLWFDTLNTEDEDGLSVLTTAFLHGCDDVLDVIEEFFGIDDLRTALDKVMIDEKMQFIANLWNKTKDGDKPYYEQESDSCRDIIQKVASIYCTDISESGQKLYFDVMKTLQRYFYGLNELIDDFMDSSYECDKESSKFLDSQNSDNEQDEKILVNKSEIPLDSNSNANTDQSSYTTIAYQTIVQYPIDLKNRKSKLELGEGSCVKMPATSVDLFDSIFVGTKAVLELLPQKRMKARYIKKMTPPATSASDSEANN